MRQAAAIDAREEFGVQRGFDGIEGGAQGVCFRAAVYGQVVAIRFDPENSTNGNKKRARVLSNEKSLSESAFPQDLIDQAAKVRPWRRRRFLPAELARAAPELRTLLVGGGPIGLAYRQCTVRNWPASRGSGLLQFPIQMRSRCRGFLVERSRAKLSCKQI
jgi:hypothetical protein